MKRCLLARGHIGPHSSFHHHTIEINAKLIHLFISKVKSHCLSRFVNWLINDCLSHYFRAHKIRWNSDLGTFPAVNRPSLWSSVLADRLHWLEGRLNQSWELQCSYSYRNSHVMFWGKKTTDQMHAFPCFSEWHKRSE